LTERSRAALANMQAALDMLDYPDIEPAMRERFLGVLRDETRTLGQRINEVESGSADSLKTRWPLEEMLGSDLVGAAIRRIETMTGLPASPVEVDATLWLKVESFTLMQALVYLAGRLSDEFEIRFVQLRLSSASGSAGKAQLDLVWSGQAMSTETVMSWEMDPMKVGNETLRLTVRDVVERHGGAFWFERERARQEGRFRFLLPLAEAGGAHLEASAVVRHDSRPEYYDFNLFAARAMQPGDALGEQRLADLSYTVFDTETTGLRPSEGDRIIQFGATRIVAGRLRRQETFEQLVDPERALSEAGIAIHGIRPEMLAGQPKLDKVLPAFHAFAHDTVLVAHNAAFDMRFLQLAEQPTGVRFEQPVLDTLLLSAVVHPKQENHSLEAIAARLGVTVLGRHTALGDAMVTAEVFMKLVPLLQDLGITTLGEALAASEQTYLARLRY